VITSVELQELAQLRLHEAEALFAAGFYDGSAYLCGYVVELAMKACVCKTLGLTEYPDREQGLERAFKTHDFNALEVLSGLRVKISSKRNTSASFKTNWSLATAWKPEDRYVISGKSRRDAEDLLDSLRSEEEGVLIWLSQQW